MSSHRAHGRDAAGPAVRRARRSPYQPPEVPDGKVNVTDPDSQADQGQRAGTCRATTPRRSSTRDRSCSRPRSPTAPSTGRSSIRWSPRRSPSSSGRASAGRPETALADAQYWNEQHMDEVIANKHIQVLIPPDGGASGKQRPGWTGGRYTWMRYVLDSASSASSCTENANR